MGRRDEADIRLHGLVGAEGFVGPLLEHPQQAHLEGRGDVPDLVEEEGAALGCGDAALPVPLGVREGAGLVPEQLGFQEGVRQGAAVEGHHRPARPGAQLVDRPGHELLARAALALDQHGAVALGDEGQQLEDLAHPVVHGGHVVEARAALRRLAQLLEDRQVAEGLHASDHLPPVVPEQGRADADGDLPAGGGVDVHALVHQGRARGHGLLERAGPFADVGLEDLPAVPPQRLLGGDADDLGRGAVEGGDQEAVIDGEHPVVDGIQDGPEVLGELFRGRSGMAFLDEVLHGPLAIALCNIVGDFQIIYLGAEHPPRRRAVPPACPHPATRGPR